jgi:hypothetical protein
MTTLTLTKILGEPRVCACGCGEEIPFRSPSRRGRFIKNHDKRKWWVPRDCGHHTNCHIWQGGGTKAGYPQISRDGQTHYAHRWFYEQENGPIPDGLVIDHLCRVTMCVNPEHLEPVVQAVNVYRGAGPRLRPEQVLEIRHALEIGVPRRSLAQRFQVHKDTIGNIARRQTWKDLP